jgi:3',5'-cyclic AMP phosphodiesterase CpdA/Tfp pilus assembly protein PilF
MAMVGLTWLHLSDWHQKGMEFDCKVVRDALLEDIKKRRDIHPDLEKLDFIVFSGDLAFSGKKEEYKAAQEYLLDPLLHASGLDKSRIFIVPGNHDLDHDSFELLPEGIKKPLTEEKEIKEWLEDNKKRSRMLEPFEAFNEFVKDYAGWSFSAYAGSYRLAAAGKDIALMGFNSALMCGRRRDENNKIDDKGKLIVGEHQVYEPLRKNQDADIRIVVLHHPFDWLTEQDCLRIENRLKQKAHFILCGHQHRPKVTIETGTEGDCILIPAGASYERRKAADPQYNNAYNFVHLDFENQKGEVFLRCWSDRQNHWREDIDAYKDGRYAFSLPNGLSTGTGIIPPALSVLGDRQNFITIHEANNLPEHLSDVHPNQPQWQYIGIPSPPRPYFAHSYPLQMNFTGRTAERHMLSNWLKDDKRPILALVAIGGMGKSALSWYWIQNDVSYDSVDGILWWSFYEGDSSFPRFLEETLIYISSKTVDPVSLPSNYDKVRALVNLLRKKRILLILDGFERQLCAYASLSAVYQSDEIIGETTDARACVDPNASKLLLDLAAGPTQAKVLITTRLMVRDLEDRVGDPLAGCRKEELKSLHLHDALTFMRAQGVTKGTRAEIITVCKSYGSHPLSLRLLSGLIARDKRNPGDIAAAPCHDVHDDLVARQHHVLEGAYNALDDNLRLLLSRMAAFRNSMNYDALAIINEFDNESKFDEALDELLERGLVFFDTQHNRYDLHPITRAYAYDRLSDPEGTHARLRKYFENIPSPGDEHVQTVDDIEMVIELYHHSVHAGFLEPAASLLTLRLRNVLYFKLATYSKYAELCLEFLNAVQSGARARKSDILEIQNRLGVSYQKMGLLHRAINELKQVNQASYKYNMTNLHYRTSNNIAQIERDLGELRHAQNDFKQAIILAREVGDRIEVGRTLQEFGLFEIITGEYESAISTLAQANKVQYAPQHNRAFAYLALSYLRIGDLQEAYLALEQAEKLASGYARNKVWVYWLFGEYNLSRNRLCESNSYLSNAITYCRLINLAELEPDILLGFARLRFIQAHQLANNSLLNESRKYADEALSIANRYEYRLKQADISNFLAQCELAAGNIDNARKYIKVAKERAWCDGPSFCYKYAMDETERLLQEIKQRS